MVNVTKKALASGAVVCLALSAGVATTANAAVNRLNGTDRFATADQIVSAGWANGASNAILASGLDANRVDALTVAPLAKKLDAPVVLVDPKASTDSIVAKFKGLKASTVYVANGAGVISDAVVNALKAQGITVNRLGGLDRYQTALNIAKQIGASDNIVVANGDDSHLVDSLSIASIAAAKGMPIFLTNGTSFDASVKAYIDGLSAKKAYVLGGSSLVSDSLYNALPGAQRLAGTERYSTNAAVINAFKSDSAINFKNVYVASGEDGNLIDALAGAALAAKNNATIVLAHDSIGTDATTLLNSVVDDSTNVSILGGTGAVTANVETALNNIENANAKLAVKSVKALNADQLQVVFSKAVDSTDAQNPLKYYLNNVQLSGSDNIQLQADGKTVVITLATPLANATTNVYQVDPIKSASDASVTTAKYTTTETMNDTVAPTVVSAKAVTNGTTATSVTIKYSEPVSGGTIKIDGQGFTAAPQPADIAADPTGLTRIVSINLDATKAHTVEFVNLADKATTTASTHNVTAYGSLSFNVTVDNVTPVISNVAPYSDKAVLVTFSKAMSLSTLQGKISAVDESLAPVAVGTIAANPADTTGTQFVVPFTTAGMYTSATTHNVTMAFATGITDTLGNAFATTTKTVTLTKDTTAPTVTAVKVDKTAGYVYLTYSEAVATSTGSVSASTIVNKNGAKVTTSGVISAASVVNGNQLRLTIAPGAAADLYTVTLPAALVKDTAETTNDAAGYTFSLDLTTAATPSTFALAAHSATAAGNVITVSYGTTVKGGAVAGSATDPNNYSVNGRILPAGTQIYLDPTYQTATITLPAGFVSTTDTAAIFRINNVQNTLGTVITPYTETLTVNDNTAPVLQSARVLSNNSIELTYNEDIKSTVASALVGTEFTISENNVAKTLVDADLTAALVSGYNNKIVINLQNSKTIDLTKTITITTLAPATGADVVDNASNDQAANTTVTVAK